MDPAFTLRLEGQEVGANRPVYGRSAAVDGSISFANPSNIIKVEVKVSIYLPFPSSAPSPDANTSHFQIRPAFVRLKALLKSATLIVGLS